MRPTGAFRALADETRVRIVNLLMGRELAVNEICRILEASQPRVSRHLKILTDGGFLFCRRDGLWAFYSVAPGGDGERLLEACRFLLEAQPRLAEDLRRAQALVAARSAESARFFNDLAEDWERLKREVLGDVDVFERIEPWVPRGRSAVDLGCGTGDLVERLSESVPKVIGVDSSPKMLEKARRRFAAAAGAVEVRMGELEHLPLRDGETGCAVISMVLHHLASPAAGLSEAHRVLEPGGRLIVVELERHTNELMRTRFGDRRLGFSPEELDALFSEAGFRKTEERRVAVKQGLALELCCGEKV